MVRAMSLPRFFHPQLPGLGQVWLEDAEARHASNVLRMELGDEVSLFDGQGGEAQARIVELSKRRVGVEIHARTDSNRELERPIELIVALPKGDRQKTLVEALVQFGVRRLTPLICERGVAQPTASALERLERSVIEASKQCGRNQLMSIATAQTIAQVTGFNLEPSLSLRLVAHPYGVRRGLQELVSDGRLTKGGVCAVVGPEGGFTDEEVEGWRLAGWQCVDLGARILRIEMAALQLAAWWASQEGESAGE